MAHPGSGFDDFCERHTVIRGHVAIQDAVSTINERINGCGLYFQWDKKDDTGFISYEALPDDTLVVISSFDFCYYYNLEMVFHGVVTHNIQADYSWPDHWSKDQIALLPYAEAEDFMRANNLPIDPACNLFAFNIGSHTDGTFQILARGFSAHSGTVFYYNRLAQEALLKDQRIAWWV